MRRQEAIAAHRPLINGNDPLLVGPCPILDRGGQRGLDQSVKAALNFVAVDTPTGKKDFGRILAEAAGLHIAKVQVPLPELPGLGEKTRDEMAVEFSGHVPLSRYRV